MPMTRSPIHFVAGLPRSGSTLLAAILRQNPRFRADVTSPVAALIDGLQPRMGSGTEFAPFFDDERRTRILRGLFALYHGPAEQGSVLFDTNRTWTARMSLIGELFPDARVICLVRDVGWILDSVERVLKNNPTRTSRALAFQNGGSVYARVANMMNHDTGLVGSAWAALREAWYGEHASRMIVIEYDRLVANPRGIMAALYAALDEAPFEHDFAHLAFDTPEYDEGLGMPGLHQIRPRVAAMQRRPSIPPDLFVKYVGASFWKEAEATTAGPRILKA
jgi:sulfotransferase